MEDNGIIIFCPLRIKNDIFCTVSSDYFHRFTAKLCVLIPAGKSITIFYGCCKCNCTSFCTIRFWISMSCTLNTIIGNRIGYWCKVCINCMVCCSCHNSFCSNLYTTFWCCKPSIKGITSLCQGRQFAVCLVKGYISCLNRTGCNCTAVCIEHYGISICCPSCCIRKIFCRHCCYRCLIPCIRVTCLCWLWNNNRCSIIYAAFCITCCNTAI